jgi:predicted amidohydrolase
MAWTAGNGIADERERTVAVAVVQFDATPEAVSDNLASMERLARSAVKQGARWIMFHEASVCDYTDRLDELAEAVPDGPATVRMTKLAAELDCFISFGLAEKDGSRRYITQVFVGPQGFIHRYRKTWLHRDPADKGFRNEYARFDPGTGPELFTFDGVQATCFICADGTSPRCIARARALAPQVVFHPLNVVAPDPTVVRGWASAHARDIGAPLLLSNRIGASWVHRGGNGGAAVFSADGKVLGGANLVGKEEVFVYQLKIPTR